MPAFTNIFAEVVSGDRIASKHVLLTSADSQVGRVYTTRDITNVIQLHAHRNVSYIFLKHETMKADFSSVNRDASIAIVG